MQHNFRYLLLFLFISLILIGCKSNGTNAPPKRIGFVNDYAAVFTEEEASALAKDLQGYEKETCHQILVLTIDSLHGEQIDKFSTRTATAWEIGQPMLKNGVLLSVALQEGRVRIEAGSGLDFIVKDGKGEEIMQKMLSYFRENRIIDGIRKGVAELKSAARQQNYPENHRPLVCK